ncbi:MAG: FtsQ-type POTRA domain-containing protein [Candidatus Hydrogenedentota bacterium]
MMPPCVRSRRTLQAKREERGLAASGLLVGLLQAGLCIGFLLLLGYVFLVFVEESMYFRVDDIHVSGTRTLDAAAVQRRAGLAPGDSMVGLPVSEAEARLDAMPFVRQSEVSRYFPNVVTIQIEERIPVAGVEMPNSIAEIDSEGVVLRELSPHELHVGPLINGEPEQWIAAAGERIESARLRAGLDVWRSFAGTALAAEMTVSEIWVKDVNDIRMFCDELPFEIRWGRGDLEKQARRLAALWEERGDELDCEYYLDLRWGKDVACW